MTCHSNGGFLFLDNNNNGLLKFQDNRMALCNLGRNLSVTERQVPCPCWARDCFVRVHLCGGEDSLSLWAA